MFSSLQNYNYKVFWYGQIVSLTGSWMQTVAQAWLVLSMTGSSVALGTVTMLQFLPILLFALVGGVVADRVNKRRFLLLTQSIALAQALALGLMTYTHHEKLWLIYILAFAGGLNQAFDNPTRQAFVVDMVGRDTLANAVALNSGTFNTARIIGPAVGGLIIDMPGLGIPAAFFANAASFLAAIAALLLMKPDQLHAGQPVNRDAMLRQVSEGVRFCFGHPESKLVLVLVAVLGTFGYNFSVALPLLAKFGLHQGAAGFGSLASCMGVGSLISATYLARRSRATRRLLLAGASLVASSRFFYLTCALMVALGFSTILMNATANTLLQMDAPDVLRGRVMSIYFLFMAGSTPIGGYFTGLMTKYIQIRPTMGLEAGICTLGVVWALAYYKRKCRSMGDPPPWMPRWWAREMEAIPMCSPEAVEGTTTPPLPGDD
jgi:MFS family permease